MKTTATPAVMLTITAYENFLVLSVDDSIVESLSEDELLAKIEGEGWVFRDTATTVGISPEAIELMANFSAAEDDEFVALSWVEEDNGTLTYLGAPHSFFHPENAKVHADWAIRGYTEIENNVPAGAIEAIEGDEFFQTLAALMGSGDVEQLAETNEQPTPTQN